MPSPDLKHYALSSGAAAHPGTVAVSTGFGDVVGTGTAFLTDYAVGDTVVVNGEEHTVNNIGGNLLMATLKGWAQTASGAAYSGYKLSPTLDALGVAWPKGLFLPYSQPLDLADASVRGAGWATAEWDWGYITRAQRELLRAFWPAYPAVPVSLYTRVRTSINDNNDEFITFLGQALWPQAEAKDATRRRPFIVKFRALVDLS